jgi:hypothetical protein
MSNYAKLADYAIKDSLTTGDPDKVVKGEELDDEFNAISVAVATKADIASPALTGTPTAPTASAGTNTTQVATTAFVTGAVTDERTAAATLTNKTITSPVINQIVHEGTADDFETTLAFTDPTADRTITFPDKAGTVAMTSELPSASALFTSSGTYAIAGSTTLTVTVTAHGRAVNDVVYLNFTSGDAVDGYYTIATVPTDNTFTVTHGTTITSSGNVTGYYSNTGLISISSTEETLVGTSTNRATTPAGVIAAVRASLVRATAQASTSGTSIDFTGIPSWVQRITVMFNGVSTTGTSEKLVQLGTSSGIVSTGYISTAIRASAGGISTGAATTGMVVNSESSTDTVSILMTIALVSENIWVSSHVGRYTTTTGSISGGGDVDLGGVLDRIRITTFDGVDTFDAGSVNIMYE